MKPRRALRFLYIAGFFVSVQQALTAYINSSFIGADCGCGIPESFVGILYTLGSIVTIAIIASFPRLTRRFGNFTITIGLIAVLVSMMAIFVFSRDAFTVSLAFVTFLAVNGVSLYALDIFLEHYTSDTNTGNTRGIYLSVINIAWVFSPFLAGQILGKGEGYTLIYGLGMIMSLVAASILIASMRTFPITRETSVNFARSLHTFWKKPALRNIFLVQFTLNFFFSWMVIYTPLYLHGHIGLPWETIGIIFAFMLTPFVIFEYPLGYLADTRYGEKEIMIIGFFIIALATGTISYLTSTEWWIWAAILFATRMGASAVQIMSESYFFKHVGDADVAYIGIFRDSTPLAYAIGPLVATVVLTIIGVSFHLLFIVLAALVLLGLIPALRIKDTR